MNYQNPKSLVPGRRKDETYAQYWQRLSMPEAMHLARLAKMFELTMPGFFASHVDEEPPK